MSNISPPHVLVLFSSPDDFKESDRGASPVELSTERTLADLIPGKIRGIG